MNGFQAEKEKNHIIRWIRDWFTVNGKEASAVIGISGGKDSTITAALLKEAIGKDRVVGVLMPNGRQTDIEDARRLVRYLGIKSMEVDISGICNMFITALGNDASGEISSLYPALSSDTAINLPPRIRMTILYAVAQSLPGGGRVANTCNRSEDYIGYSTKYGDAAGDFAPLAGFTVRQVVAIGDALELPHDLAHKTPSDGLCGKTDEENIGFSYEILDTYLETGVCDDKEILEEIESLHRINLHKINPMQAYQPSY